MGEQKEVVITADCPTDVADGPSDILSFPGYVSRNERSARVGVGILGYEKSRFIGT